MISRFICSFVLIRVSLESNSVKQHLCFCLANIKKKQKQTWPIFSKNGIFYDLYDLYILDIMALITNTLFISKEWENA